MFSTTALTIILATQSGQISRLPAQPVDNLSGLLLSQNLNSVEPPMSLAILLDRIRPIPVFVVADAKGNPIFATQQNLKVIPLFFNIEEARGFLPGLIKSSGVNNLKIFVASLADFYGKSGYKFEYIGAEFEKSFALTLIQKSSPKETEFKGVPVFFLVEPSGNYLTVSEQNTNRVPIFFSSVDAENLKKEAGKISNSMNKLTVKATSFESIVEILVTKPAKTTMSFKFLPHPESLRKAAEILQTK